MDKKIILQVGGNLESALKGEYVINVKSVITEAWQITQRARKPINLALLFVFSLAVLVTLLCAWYLGGFEKIQSNEPLLLIVNVIVTVTIWPFFAAIEMMGIFNAVNIRVRLNLLFAFLKKSSWIALGALLSTMIVNLGLSLFILPGIFLGVALSFTIQLMLNMNITPTKAILISLKATRFQWFQLFFTYLFLLMVFILISLPLMLLSQTHAMLIGAIFFFFGLSYLAPLYFTVKGILYREIFGLQLQTENPGQANSSFYA